MVQSADQFVKQPLSTSRRYVSRLTHSTLAVVMAGGRGERLKALTDHRCKPATHFGGKFRIIDFVLSNCVNSGIRRISILTQYKAHSLIQHIQRGWNYLRGEFGEFIEIVPAQQQLGDMWYRGTADRVRPASSRSGDRCRALTRSPIRDRRTLRRSDPSRCGGRAPIP